MIEKKDRKIHSCDNEIKSQKRDEKRNWVNEKREKGWILRVPEKGFF
jgi:hypothetical protein